MTTRPTEPSERGNSRTSEIEITLPWKVTRPDGTLVEEGVTQTAEGQTFSPWELTLKLPAGDYILAMLEDDPSGGDSGFAPDVDSRSFTIS